MCVALVTRTTRRLLMGSTAGPAASPCTILASQLYVLVGAVSIAPAWAVVRAVVTKVATAEGAVSAGVEGLGRTLPAGSRHHPSSLRAQPATARRGGPPYPMASAPIDGGMRTPPTPVTSTRAVRDEAGGPLRAPARQRRRDQRRAGGRCCRTGWRRHSTRR